MRSLLPTLCLAATAAAQSVTIPSMAATVRPTIIAYWSGEVFYSTTSTTNSQSRTQTIVDTADVTVPAAVWNSLATRRPVGLGNSNPAFTATATIVMSVSPNAWTVASTSFAANHGTNMTTVLSGQISLPARANQATWPYAWEAPFPFSAPFPFAQALGKSLVIDITQTANTGTTSWYVEATPPDLGSRAENGGPQSTCKFSNGNYNSGIGYRYPLPGGQWFVQYSNVLPNAIGIAAIGAQGVGGNWNGIPLKFDLGPLGAPGCSWNVSVAYMIGIAANASGLASWPTLNIPNDPALAGAKFYDHAALIDPAANALGLVTLWSSTWGIGTRIGAPAAFVSSVSTLNPTGNVQPGFCPTFQLNP